MMIIIVLLMLLAPGLISMRMLWKLKELASADYKLIISDYIIYSFLIQLSCYLVMFLSYPERLVSFSLSNVWTHSHIYSASFVVKYSMIAVITALLLPSVITKMAQIVYNLEEERKHRIQKIKDEEK